MLTHAARGGVPPLPVHLADGRGVAEQAHARVAAEDDGGSQQRAALYVLQPAIVQRARVPAIDLYANTSRDTTLPT